jgi:hypothetical protein
MEIVYTNSCIVDNKKDEILPCNCETKDYDDYVNSFLYNISNNKNSTYYEKRSDYTEVLSAFKEMLKEILDESEIVESEEEQQESKKLENLFQTIAKRFLESEKKNQKKINNANQEIKKGRLNLVVIAKYDYFQILIAKSDSVEILTDQDSHKAKGTEISSKNLGKSCLINLHKTEEKIEIGDIRVLLDNSASYFHDLFLEIDPLYKDDHNTKTLIRSVLTTIDQSFKKKYPRDRLILKSALNHYTETHDFIIYEEVVNNVFTKYLKQEDCVIDQQIITRFFEKLDDLPEKKGFGRQFTIDRKAIPASKVKTTYKLNENLELTISKTADPNMIKEKIRSGEDTTGETYIKIYTKDEDTLRAFEVRSDE